MSNTNGQAASSDQLPSSEGQQIQGVFTEKSPAEEVDSTPSQTVLDPTKMFIPSRSSPAVVNGSGIGTPSTKACERRPPRSQPPRAQPVRSQHSEPRSTRPQQGLPYPLPGRAPSATIPPPNTRHESHRMHPQQTHAYQHGHQYQEAQLYQQERSCQQMQTYQQVQPYQQLQPHQLGQLYPQTQPYQQVQPYYPVQPLYQPNMTSFQTPPHTVLPIPLNTAGHHYSDQYSGPIDVPQQGFDIPPHANGTQYHPQQMILQPQPHYGTQFHVPIPLQLPLPAPVAPASFVPPPIFDPRVGQTQSELRAAIERIRSLENSLRIQQFMVHSIDSRVHTTDQTQSSEVRAEPMDAEIESADTQFQPTEAPTQSIAAGVSSTNRIQSPELHAEPMDAMIKSTYNQLPPTEATTQSPEVRAESVVAAIESADTQLQHTEAPVESSVTNERGLLNEISHATNDVNEQTEPVEENPQASPNTMISSALEKPPSPKAPAKDDTQSQKKVGKSSRKPVPLDYSKLSYSQRGNGHHKTSYHKRLSPASGSGSQNTLASSAHSPHAQAPTAIKTTSFGNGNSRNSQKKHAPLRNGNFHAGTKIKSTLRAGVHSLSTIVKAKEGADQLPAKIDKWQEVPQCKSAKIHGDDRNGAATAAAKASNHSSVAVTNKKSENAGFRLLEVEDPVDLDSQGDEMSRDDQRSAINEDSKSPDVELKTPMTVKKKEDDDESETCNQPTTTATASPSSSKHYDPKSGAAHYTETDQAIDPSKDDAQDSPMNDTSSAPELTEKEIRDKKKKRKAHEIYKKKEKERKALELAKREREAEWIKIMNIKAKEIPIPYSNPELLPFEIKYILGKGFGLVATKLIEAREQILAEVPLILAPMRDFDAYYDRLPDEHQQAILSLSCVGCLEATCMWKIWRANVMTNANYLMDVLDSKGSTLKNMEAIYEVASRINNSCVPNTKQGFNANGTVVFFAIRDIQKGEEITRSYTEVNYDRWFERHKALSERWDFDCICQSCQSKSTLDVIKYWDENVPFRLSSQHHPHLIGRNTSVAKSEISTAKSSGKECHQSDSMDRSLSANLGEPPSLEFWFRQMPKQERQQPSCNCKLLYFGERISKPDYIADLPDLGSLMQPLGKSLRTREHKNKLAGKSQLEDALQNLAISFQKIDPSGERKLQRRVEVMRVALLGGLSPELSESFLPELEGLQESADAEMEVLANKARETCSSHSRLDVLAAAACKIDCRGASNEGESGDGTARLNDSSQLYNEREIKDKGTLRKDDEQRSAETSQSPSPDILRDSFSSNLGQSNSMKPKSATVSELTTADTGCDIESQALCLEGIEKPQTAPLHASERED